MNSTFLSTARLASLSLILLFAAEQSFAQEEIQTTVPEVAAGADAGATPAPVAGAATDTAVAGATAGAAAATTADAKKKADLAKKKADLAKKAAAARAAKQKAIRERNAKLKKEMTGLQAKEKAGKLTPKEKARLDRLKKSHAQMVKRAAERKARLAAAKNKPPRAPGSAPVAAAGPTASVQSNVRFTSDTIDTDDPAVDDLAADVLEDVIAEAQTYADAEEKLTQAYSANAPDAEIAQLEADAAAEEKEYRDAISNALEVLTELNGADEDNPDQFKEEISDLNQQKADLDAVAM